MTKKKLDSRILSFLKSQNRSLFVVVGDKAQDACVTLHYLLNNTTTAENKNVIWCYKNELGFSTSKQKRMRSSKKPAQTDSPFELFVTCTDIRYCYYKETDSILGQTCQMLILQDFESITPNVLAKTIETVQAGGLVVLLLNTIKSLKQLYSLSMDVHARYRTEKHQDTVCRFNERFLLSLAACPQCLMMDDELNILPISAGKSCIQTVAVRDTTELEELVTSLQDTLPIGPLVGCCRTIDQAKAVLQFVDSIAEKTLRSTVTLTAARGRGKSAALGIAVASAVAYGYSNIFITSPTPENLKTLFQFILKGFDCLGYKEHLDYDVLQSTNPDFHKSIIRINVFKDHRQTIQWIQPGDYQVLAQAELLVIDEAAAIPLPLIKKLLGPYLVFMASTTNGYEGTGRSLSLKLYKQLRQESSTADKLGRSLREVSLEEPIRYLPNDEIEKWLNNLLCLDASVTNKAVGCPHPKECELYSVNRDTLFSFHPVSEQFLQMTMALYVAGHYKNSPNDLQLLSDAPAHQLFVLLPPTGGSRLPEPLVVVQVCLEGKIAQESVKAQMSRGVRANGDLIPWVVSQQFQDDQFAALSGARIVRVATHPNYMGMGYGSRAVELLTDYYAGKITNLSEEITEAKLERVTEDELMVSLL